MTALDLFGYILASVICSAGGVGAIVLLFLKLGANIITDRMSQKVQKNFEKEVEKYKAELNTKQYVSISRFDKEFSLYQDLNDTFFELVKAISLLIPSGNSHEPVDEKLNEELKAEHLRQSLVSWVEAQDILLKNEPFLNEMIYENFNKMLLLARTQIWVIQQKNNILNVNPQKGVPSFEDYKRTSELVELFKLNNKEIRTYLLSLDIIS